MDAGGIRPGFLWKLLIPTIGDMDNVLDFSSPYRLKIVSNKSRHRGRATKRQIFFVSNEADGYFMSSPLEWGFEVFIREDIRKQGF